VYTAAVTGPKATKLSVAKLLYLAIFCCRGLHVPRGRGNCPPAIRPYGKARRQGPYTPLDIPVCKGREAMPPRSSVRSPTAARDAPPRTGEPGARDQCFAVAQDRQGVETGSLEVPAPEAFDQVVAGS